MQAGIVLKRYARLLVVFIAFIALIEAGFVFYHSQAFTNATSYQPQRFTELYFTDPAHLPTTANSGQRLPVDMTIHNVEDQDMNYTVRISYVSPSGHMTVLETQQLSLGNGQTKTLSDNVTIPAGVGRYDIVVQLANLPEALHMWIDVV